MAKLEKIKANTENGKAIKAIKNRQKKIDNAGVTLVELWFTQGKELNELQLILECSQRQLAEHTGLKRSAINTYINIAEDPRLGEPDTIKQLGVFTQKQLLTLGKLDEDEFNEAVEKGALPKAEVVEAEPVKDSDPKPDATTEEWRTTMIKIVTEGLNVESIMAHLNEEFAEAEVVEEAESLDEVNPDRALLLDALSKTGLTDEHEQAETLGIKPKALSKALNENKITMSIINKCKEYLAVA